MCYIVKLNFVDRSPLLCSFQTCSRLVINEPLASETTDHTHKELTRAVERTSVVMEAIHELLQKSDADASSSNATPGSQPESPMVRVLPDGMLFVFAYWKKRQVRSGRIV